MKDNLSIVILAMVFVVLVVIFPLYNFFEKQDDMSYNMALKATVNFVDKVLQNGYLDTETYNQFILDLANSGNIYDIELEIHRQTITADPNNLEKIDGDYKYHITQYKIDYTEDIMNKMSEDIKSPTLTAEEVKNGLVTMEIGDGFFVKLKNSNVTIAGALFNSLISTSSTERIVVNYGGLIKNTAWKMIDATYDDIIELYPTKAPTT